LVSFLKEGIPAVSAVLTVFETLKNIDFQGGNSQMKPKRGLGCNRGIPQEK